MLWIPYVIPAAHPLSAGACAPSLASDASVGSSAARAGAESSSSSSTAAVFPAAALLAGASAAGGGGQGALDRIQLRDLQVGRTGWECIVRLEHFTEVFLLKDLCS